MADKTTTLKTKAKDNVYPNIIGDNMDNAISDSPQIKHTLTADHKIIFWLDTIVNNLINNSLQKPEGLTKTKLVGVGTNGQENIEIGDNLTLSNGKLSATGGEPLPAGTEDNPFIIDNLNVYIQNYWLFLKNQYAATNIYIGHQQYSDQSHIELILSTYSNANTIGSTKKIITSWNRYNQIFNLLAPNSSGDFDVLSLKRTDFKNKGIVSYYKDSDGIFATSVSVPTDKTESYYLNATYDSTSRKTTITWSALKKTYNHFITLTNNTSTFYFTYQNTSNEKLNTLDSLKTALSGKSLLCTGHTDTEKAEYISGEIGSVVVGVVDNSDNSTSGITIDSSYTITDDVSPVE